MEFNVKLQELRKRKGLTQDELAECLYVSRPAISKWESGRGYPSIDSLKAISKFFGVTIDDLLSSDELIIIAEEDNKQKENQICDLVFGLLDCGTVMLFFLPFFAQRENGVLSEVSIISLIETAPYLKIAYFVIIIAIVLCGILTLFLKNYQKVFWVKNKSKLSLALNAIGVLLFTVSLQPYSAAVLFVFLLIKTFLLIKWQ